MPPTQPEFSDEDWSRILTIGIDCGQLEEDTGGTVKENITEAKHNAISIANITHECYSNLKGILPEIVDPVLHAKYALWLTKFIPLEELDKLLLKFKNESLYPGDDRQLIMISRFLEKHKHLKDELNNKYINLTFEKNL